ncbi:MAG: beta-N-acetylglucosaminidase domain-containing protein [SAR86 cluster bacterium]|uniref:Beta-N-acetylglucosaminidase domain-containing protein n=1 Tax=SAR86 cluster bacterium TaxID=2030880 RepID=A0A937LMR1_9GAMM|nr:beta-N-acetylglucosaminidase domain-containing protein [SAR86 cluster bacterium]
MQSLGIVEGYYGGLYNFAERRSLISSLSEAQLNSYFYAPKEDPFLRGNFHLYQSETWRSEFKDFVQLASEKSVEITVGLTPCSKQHIDLIEEKIDYFCELGCKKIALLFDDLEQFKADEQLQALNKAKLAFPEVAFLFCPTVYAQELIGKDSQHTTYFQEFLENCPEGIDILWTGKKVISTNLNFESESAIAGFPSERIAIWDNYFTIDSCPKRFNLTNFNHLDKSYLKNKANYFVNLTGMERTDKLIIDIFGNLLSSSGTKFKNILQRHGVPDALIEMIDLFDPEIKIKLLESDKEKLHKIIFSWFHPLKNEWYPYLHNLKNWG